MFDNNLIIEDIATFFGVSVTDLHATPIRKLSENNIWKIEIGQRNFVLKRHFIHAPINGCKFTPFEIELNTLKVLKSKGCNVPKIIWQSDKKQSLLIEWCGNQTLDDMAQNQSDWQPIVSQAISQFCYIEEAFKKSQDNLTAYVFPVNQDKKLQEILGHCRKTIFYIIQASKKEKQPLE